MNISKKVEPYQVPAHHGQTKAWQVDCAGCGNGIYLGTGALSGIKRLITTMDKPLCDICFSKGKS